MRLVIPAFLLAASVAAAQEYSPGKIDWVRDPGFGLKKAKLEGRATMLYFTADW